MVICSYRIDFIIIIIIVLRFVLHLFAFIAFFNGRMQFLYSTHYKSFQFVILFFLFLVMLQLAGKVYVRLIRI